MFLKRISRVFSSDFVKNLPRNAFWTFNRTAEFDTEYLCDPKNLEEIKKNISNRKGVGDIDLVQSLKTQLDCLDKNDEKYQMVLQQFLEQSMKIPNRTHPEVVIYGDEPKIVRDSGRKREFELEPKDFQEITKRLRLVRTEQLGNLSGSKSYYILGDLAELEQALIRYFTGNLLKNGFKLVSVPDILHRDIVEGCGMNTRGTRTQVYSLNDNLHGPDLCLSGTSEMALAGFLANKQIPKEQLPLKLAAVSRCYRAETSNLLDERGIYRVHEFTKVEMFLVSMPEKSDELLEYILKLEEDSFTALGLHFKVLDMPPHELGAQAYRKYDIEAWLCGRKIYGEISSCSNCLDYQSRRLGIKFKDSEGNLKFVHTLNGTACAIPRLLIGLIEQGQNVTNGTVDVPEVLWEYFRDRKVIGRQKRVPELKLIKNKKYFLFL